MTWCKCALGLSNILKGIPVLRKTILACLPPMMITRPKDTPPITRDNKKTKKREKKKNAEKQKKKNTENNLQTPNRGMSMF